MTDAPKLRGFAAMKARDPERLKQIAASGGKNVPSDKRSFSKDRDLATSAGQKSRRPKGNADG